VERLFDDQDKYTEEALALDRKVCEFLAEVVEDYGGAGYSVRDVTSIIVNAATICEAEYLVGRIIKENP